MPKKLPTLADVQRALADAGRVDTDAWTQQNQSRVKALIRRSAFTVVGAPERPAVEPVKRHTAADYVNEPRLLGEKLGSRSEASRVAAELLRQAGNMTLVNLLGWTPGWYRGGDAGEAERIARKFDGDTDRIQSYIREVLLSNGYDKVWEEILARVETAQAQGLAAGTATLEGKRPDGSYMLDGEVFRAESRIEPGMLVFIHALGEYRPVLLKRKDPDGSGWFGRKWGPDGWEPLRLQKVWRARFGQELRGNSTGTHGWDDIARFWRTDDLIGWMRGRRGLLWRQRAHRQEQTAQKETAAQKAEAEFGPWYKKDKVARSLTTEPYVSDTIEAAALRKWLANHGVKATIKVRRYSQASGFDWGGKGPGNQFTDAEVMQIGKMLRSIDDWSPLSATTPGTREFKEHPNNANRWTGILDHNRTGTGDLRVHADYLPELQHLLAVELDKKGLTLSEAGKKALAWKKPRAGTTRKPKPVTTTMTTAEKTTSSKPAGSRKATGTSWPWEGSDPAALDASCTVVVVAPKAGKDWWKVGIVCPDTKNDKGRPSWLAYHLWHGIERRWSKRNGEPPAGLMAGLKAHGFDFGSGWNDAAMRRLAAETTAPRTTTRTSATEPKPSPKTPKAKDEEPARRRSRLDVEKLEALASKLDGQIDELINSGVGQQNWTPRRGRMAAGMRERGEALKRFQRTLRAMIEDAKLGRLPEALWRIGNRTEAALLAEPWNRLRGSMHYSEQYHQHDEKDKRARMQAILNGEVKPKLGAVKEFAYPGKLREENRQRSIRSLDDPKHRRKKDVAAARAALRNMRGGLMDPDTAKKIRKAMKTTGGQYSIDSWTEDTAAKVGRADRMGIASPSKWHEAVLAFWPYWKAGQSAAPRATKTEKRIKEIKNQLRTAKIPGFFPTPDWLADEMAERAMLDKDSVMLEPGGGTGALVMAAFRAAPQSSAVVFEQQASACELLKLMDTAGHLGTADGRSLSVSCGDFMEQPVGAPVSHVLTNPPYEKGQDADTVMRAWEWLAPGGRLVGLVSEGLFFREDKKARAFRAWMDEHDGESVKLDKAFGDRRAFRRTDVNARMIIVDKADR